MSDVRFDPLTGRAAVIRTDRVPPFHPGTLPVVARCPFCKGREEETRPTITERTDADGWVVRAFANRRPGLLSELEDRTGDDPLLHGRTGVGAHEVIVETPDHDVLSLAHQQATLAVVADRLEDLERDDRFRALVWFRNRCLEAGSSQPHPHSQIVATPYVPVLVETLVRSQAERPGLVQELAARAGDRQVFADEHLIAFCPWAPVYPFEVVFAPRRATSHLWHAREVLPSLGRALHQLTGALDAWSGRAPYNLVLYQAPLRTHAPHFSWHVRLMPRFVRPGGFELWSGGALHPMPPEQAAMILRGRRLG